MGETTLRLAVFDVDGTLVDSQHTIVAAMRTAFTGERQRPPEPSAVRRVVGLSLVEAIRRLSPSAGSGTHHALGERYKEAFHRLHRAGDADDPLFPGAREVLDLLEGSGWLLGVATGKGRRGLDATLAWHGLEDRFVTVQTADVALGKPDPDMLLRAMAETGAEAGATVMIGDTSYDMRMAQNAGTAAIGVAWGYHPADELRAAGADAVVEAFDDLPAAVDTVVDAA